MQPLTTAVQDGRTMRRYLSWLRLSLRELFLLTVIAALSLMIWKQSHQPVFANSGIADAVNQGLSQKLSTHGNVLSYSSMNMVNGNKVWQFSYDVTATGAPVSEHVVLSTLLSTLSEQAAKSKCKLDYVPGSGANLSVHSQYEWQQGRGTAQAVITHPSADKVVINLMFYEHSR